LEHSQLHHWIEDMNGQQGLAPTIADILLTRTRMQQQDDTGPAITEHPDDFNHQQRADWRGSKWFQRFKRTWPMRSGKLQTRDNMTKSEATYKAKPLVPPLFSST